MISVQFIVLFGRRISENHYHHRLTFSQLVGKEFPDLKVENFLISEYHDLIGENCPMFTERLIKCLFLPFVSAQDSELKLIMRGRAFILDRKYLIFSSNSSWEEEQDTGWSQDVQPSK